MAMRRYIIALTLFSSAASAAAQDQLVAMGERVFSACESCHVVGDTTKVTKYGPHLNELFGRKPGSLPEPIYSLAMVTFGENHIWDEATLTAFLRDPAGVVVGSNMKFSGLKKDEEIRALLAYLATFDKNGMVPK